MGLVGGEQSRVTVPTALSWLLNTYSIVHCILISFQFIELNGMWLTEPRQAYVQLLKALTGQTTTAEQAQQLLERRFSRTAHRRITTLVLVDEVITAF